MEQTTKISAEEGKQELVITREFELPLELLFKAYVEPDIVEQWMGTKVLKLETTLWRRARSIRRRCCQM